MEKERFCLLLLEPGETYFEDFSGLWFKKGAKEQVPGRLKLCSRSAVFEPRETALPLVKLPLQHCSRVDPSQPILTENIGDGVEIECNQVIEMLPGNILAPYSFLKESQTFIFVPTYMDVEHILRPLSQLHRAATLPLQDHNNMVATIIFSRQARFKFDPQWLEDFSERIIFEATANKVTPLVVNPGRVVLTNSILYFQPFNNIEQTVVLKIRLRHVRRVTNRRFLLRHLGLEIECCPQSSVPRIYFSLESASERDSFAEALLSQDLELDNLRQDEMTLKWQNSVISNYEYLSYLNSLADRSTSDLTQYPVFPWVICDYESKQIDLKNPLVFRDLTKPVGALDSVRLQKLLDRYDEMDPPKFLYGSHYSAPGLVLFYLVRQYPHLMLCLQNGRFDHPDRMFNSMKDVWRNINTNMSDFKELTPEFYDPEQEGRFCTNLFGINFGHRHDGRKVGDVELPPWASNSKDFVVKMREALESDIVSSNLNHWIDLIFGYKQMGEEAEKAHNIFYPMCYEGSVDLDSEMDFGKRHALEVQIMEFGQIPKQLFQVPHPPKLPLSPQSPIHLNDVTDSLITSKTFSEETIVCKEQEVQRAHRDYVSGVTFSSDRLYSVGQDGTLKIFKLPDLAVERSATLSSLPLSCCTVLPGATTVLAGSWDNNLHSYEVEFGRRVELLAAHEDAVTCLQWRPGLLVSGSWDCSVRLWRVEDATLGKHPIRGPQAYVAELPHENKINSICVQRDFVLSGSSGEVILWDLETRQQLKNFPCHNDDVVGAFLDPDCRQVLTCGSDSQIRLYDLNSGLQVFCKTITQQPTQLAWRQNRLLVGTLEGLLLAWDLRQVRQISQIQAHKGAITAVGLDEAANYVASGGTDRSVSLWRFAEL
ncbi:protein FAN-like isoform X2 [Neocloeon triangulifer]|uniref:protein FAN-like isoform X2 n=1 Tax=Neocloeon triangulifer TaxID=2078957 RepID=UPI00286F799C|nr:protein FAN-like isoform X2 [Neocloeon triangulifer]